MLAYLQNETELTRSTLVRILKESGRLAEFFIDPSDSWMRSRHPEARTSPPAGGGIKYERIDGTDRKPNGRCCSSRTKN